MKYLKKLFLLTILPFAVLAAALVSLRRWIRNISFSEVKNELDSFRGTWTKLK